MKSRYLIYILLVSFNVIFVSAANADDEGPALSFSQPDTYNVVAKSVKMLSTWAQGEYVEHQSLFTKHPKDNAVILATMALVKELTQLSKKAKASGDEHKALAYLFSAEATARYAAILPHLLEERIKQKNF